jgi:hypothetical protein
MSVRVLARSIAVLSALTAASVVQAQAKGHKAAAAEPNVAMGDTVGGIACDAQEGQRIHIHQHLVIFDHGKQVAIPDNVGQPAGRRCIYWLHTHTPDGIIHIEAPLDRSFTLGDFFKVWNQPLSKTTAASAHAAKGATLRVWVDGKPFAGDPRTIPLKAHTDVVIEAGPPFPTPPRFTNWGTL